VGDAANCGTCGHACSGVGDVVCQGGACCQLNTGVAGAPCSPALPCCFQGAATSCQNGACCLGAAVEPVDARLSFAAVAILHGLDQG
jgi:hypothetical protein